MSSKCVTTVLGTIPSTELGVTLPHEHILIYNTSWWKEPEPASKRALANSKVTIENLGLVKRDPIMVKDNLILDDIDLAIREIEFFKMAGGQTIVDLTSKRIGRDPEALAAISRMTQINIIMGCGYYTHDVHPTEIESLSVEQISEDFTKEILDGVESTGIRCGVIGEIGTSSCIHPNEEKVLRAASSAQSQTGIAISVHAAQWQDNTMEILDILEDSGADLSRVILSHRDQKYPFKEQIPKHIEIARRGAYVEYDVWGCEWDFESLNEGIPSDHHRVEGFLKLTESGLIERLLASNDICTKTQLRAYGGYGYSHVITNGATILKRAGFSEEELDTIFIKNPKRVLELETC
jgi:phosphotriesterase-related protein